MGDELYCLLNNVKNYRPNCYINCYIRQSIAIHNIRSSKKIIL